MSRMAMNDYQKMGREIMAEEEMPTGPEMVNKGVPQPGMDTKNLSAQPMTTYETALEMAKEEMGGQEGGDSMYGRAFQIMVDQNVGWEGAAQAPAVSIFQEEATPEIAQIYDSFDDATRQQILDTFASGAPVSLEQVVREFDQQRGPAPTIEEIDADPQGTGGTPVMPQR